MDERPDVVLDIDRLKRNCHDNMDIVNELLSHLLEKSRAKWMAALDEALASGDPTAVEEVCHSIKGSSSTVFAWRISNQGLVMEKLAHGGDMDAVRTNIVVLQDKFSELAEWMQVSLKV